MQASLRDLLKYNLEFRIGAGLILIVVAMAGLSFVSPYPPADSFVVAPDVPPNATNWFGTTSRGQDVFWQLTFAIRNTLAFGLAVALLSRVLSLVVGLTAGYLGGWVDRALMSINDIFIVIPLFPVLILFYFVLRDGMSTREILMREHLPYVMPIVFSTTMNNMNWSIGLEVTLAVLGFMDINAPTIGGMLYWANQHTAVVAGVWWWIAFPVGLIVMTFVGLFLLAVSMNEYIDPRSRLSRMGAGA